MNDRVLLGALTGDDAAVSALVADLLAALCDESRALRCGDPARLAAAQSRKRHLLRLMTPAGADPGRAGN